MKKYGLILFTSIFGLTQFAFGDQNIVPKAKASHDENLHPITTDTHGNGCCCSSCKDPIEP